MSITLAEHLDHFSHRFLQEVLDDATASYWLKRAQAFEDAKPDPIRDYCGRATREELRERWKRCHEVAKACRARAQLTVFRDGIEPEVTEALREVA